MVESEGEWLVFGVWSSLFNHFLLPVQGEDSGQVRWEVSSRSSEVQRFVARGWTNGWRR